MTREQIEKDIASYDGQWEELSVDEREDLAELEFLLSGLLNKE